MLTSYSRNQVKNAFKKVMSLDLNTVIIFWKIQRMSDEWREAEYGTTWCDIYLENS